MHVDADAPVEVLEEIRLAAERTSPMFDNIARGAPTTATVRHASPPADPVEA